MKKIRKDNIREVTIIAGDKAMTVLMKMKSSMLTVTTVAYKVFLSVLQYLESVL